MMKLMKLKQWERVLMFQDGELVRILEPGWRLVTGDAERVDIRDVVFQHERLDEISRSPLLAGEAHVAVVQKHQRALVWRDGELIAVLGRGRHILWRGWGQVAYESVSMRDVGLVHRELETIAQSGLLAGVAEVLDLADHERVVVRRAGRVVGVLGASLHVVWTGERATDIERFDARVGRLETADLRAVVEADGFGLLDSHLVAEGQVGAVFREGKLVELLDAGFYAFWDGPVSWDVTVLDVREDAMDVAAQEIVTRDKVSLRLNALVTWRVADVKKALTSVADFRQSLYREAQMALRAVIGTRDLDVLLEDKDAVAEALTNILSHRARAFGVEVVGLGIRDVILPGDMRELLNKVTEARKAAEAAVITRREETAAIRSQANTAKLLERNPTLMRMRELEALERIASRSNLTVFAGEEGLAGSLSRLAK